MDRWTLAPNDLRYPNGLIDLKLAPILRIRGLLPTVDGVTIVGTRGSTREGDRFAEGLAADLVRAGFAVWSGGALGIDGAAHRGALEAGGPTVAVIGSGLDNPTPVEHLALFEEIVARGGAVVSRQDDEEPAATSQYHARNAVLAAATRLTVVVECPVRSGAMSTVRHARFLGRRLAFVPHAPWMPAGAGCVAEIQKGASLVTSVGDVLALLGVPREPAPSQAPAPSRSRKAQTELFVETAGSSTPSKGDASSRIPDGLSPLELRVYAALDRALHLDELCERLGEPVMTLVPALFGLVISGVVVEDAPSLFRRLT